MDIYGAYQNVIDWAAVKNHGVGFVWVKLTDGAGPADVRGDRQVAGAKSVAIPVGGYHFVQAHPSPEAQADLFADEVLRLRATDLAAMLDLEDNPPRSQRPNIPDGQKRDFAIRFCRQVARRGLKPGVYMNNSLASKLHPDQWDVSGLVIWIARYGAQPDPAAGRYDAHQYSSSGHVPGITAQGVDLNESYTTNIFAIPPEVRKNMSGIVAQPLPSGQGYYHWPVEVGSNSLRVKRLWFAYSVGGANGQGSYELVIYMGRDAGGNKLYGQPVAGSPMKATHDNDDRMYFELPSGAESISLQYDTEGAPGYYFLGEEK
jgi:GH25 family lysozyme M1 (1,4-beta-N-acetylmuramidase)